MTTFFKDLKRYQIFVIDTGRTPQGARQLWMKLDDDNASCVGIISEEPLGPAVEFKSYVEVRGVKTC